jgi:galactokinase
VPREVRAFAPGRVNLIGEHTDYNHGLALPFAIAEGVTVRARTHEEKSIHAHALDLGEHDEFAVPCGAPALPAPPQGGGWRAFVRGIAAELHSAGLEIPGAELEISGNLPRGAGLSSSAALEVALALALLALADAGLDPRKLAQLCSDVENDWVGARTGLLDQLASLFGERAHALLIDFSDLDVQPVPLALGDGWRLVTLDSGEPHALAASGYNERRAECARACELLGVESLREAGGGSPLREAGGGSLSGTSLREAGADRPSGGQGGRTGALDPLLAGGLALEEMDRLPPVLVRRVMHVLGENERVLATVAALREHDLPRVGALLDSSHVSLRYLYECSTPAVEAAVEHLKEAGALGARMVGGGFGGHVLGLLPPGAPPPEGSREVQPSAGARLLS